MALPRARGKRVDVYLDDEVYVKAIRRFQNLDAKIEQLLRDEIAREEEADAAHGFGGSFGPASQGFEDLGAGDPFQELNPDAGLPQGGPPDQIGQGKWNRLPVLKPKRKK